MKAYNRKSETLLSNAETFTAIASIVGTMTSPRSLEPAWRDVLFNQFHDILPGSGIRENYIDATEKYQHAEKLGLFALDNSLREIEKRINTSSVKKGIPFIVFNRESHERSDIVELALEPGDTNTYAVYDVRGKTIPSQVRRDNDLQSTLMFVARGVPSHCPSCGHVAAPDRDADRSRLPSTG